MCLCNFISPEQRRPDINEYFMAMAELVGTRSTWPGTHVGCVVAHDRQVVSTGYNGTPRGWHNNPGRASKKYFCHAEENAIVQAARQGIRLGGSVFYVSISPCMTCARMMVNVGASAVYYRKFWDDDEALEVASMMQKLRVPLIHVPKK